MKITISVLLFFLIAMAGFVPPKTKVSTKKEPILKTISTDTVLKKPHENLIAEIEQLKTNTKKLEKLIKVSKRDSDQKVYFIILTK